MRPGSIKHLFDRHPDPDEQVVVVTDTLPVKRTKRAVEKAFKTYIAQNLGSRSYTIVHHSSAAHACLQVADYCTWAVQRKWQHGDERSYQLIRPFVRSELEI